MASLVNGQRKAVMGEHAGFFVINRRIKVTFEHPFLVRRGDEWGFCSADLLKVGDWLIGQDQRESGSTPSTVSTRRCAQWRSASPAPTPTSLRVSGSTTTCPTRRLLRVSPRRPPIHPRPLGRRAITADRSAGATRVRRTPAAASTAAHRFTRQAIIRARGTRTQPDERTPMSPTRGPVQPQASTVRN